MSPPIPEVSSHWQLAHKYINLQKHRTNHQYKEHIQGTRSAVATCTRHSNTLGPTHVNIFHVVDIRLVYVTAPLAHAVRKSVLCSGKNTEVDKKQKRPVRPRATAKVKDEVMLLFDVMVPDRQRGISCTPIDRRSRTRRSNPLTFKLIFSVTELILCAAISVACWIVTSQKQGCEKSKWDKLYECMGFIRLRSREDDTPRREPKQRSSKQDI